jgi:putative peptidoglycan lipid II flippase
VAVLAQSAASALIPTYVRISAQQGRAAARRLAAVAMAWTVALLAAVALLLVFVAPWLFPLLGLGFGEEKLALAESLFYWMAAILVVSGGSAILGAALNAEDHFAAAAVAPAAVPLCTLGVFWMYQGQAGVYALAIGTLVGYIAELVILSTAAARRGIIEPPRSGAGTEFGEATRQYWPLAIGALLMSGSTFVDSAMAASLGRGNVSVLNYGSKVVALALSIVAASLSTVLFPRFSRMVADGNYRQLLRTLAGYVKLVLLMSAPLVVVLVFASQPIVRLLFERGAFTAEDTRAASGVQMWLALEIPFYVVNMIGIRVLSALGNNGSVLRIAALNLVVNIVGDYLLMRWYGVNGIAMSSSLVYVIAASLTLWTIQKKLRAAELASSATATAPEES